MVPRPIEPVRARGLLYQERIELYMVVKGGYLVECGGKGCAASDPKGGRGRKPNHGQTLGEVRMSDGCRAEWYREWRTEYREAAETRGDPDVSRSRATGLGRASASGTRRGRTARTPNTG